MSCFTLFHWTPADIIARQRSRKATNSWMENTAVWRKVDFHSAVWAWLLPQRMIGGRKKKKQTNPKQPTKKPHPDTSEFWKSPTLLVTPHLLPSHGVKFGSWNRGIWPRTVFIAGSINESLSKGLNHRFSLVHWYSSQELPVNEDVLEEPACLWLGDIPPTLHCPLPP